VKPLLTLALAALLVVAGAQDGGAQQLQPQDIAGWSLVPSLQSAVVYENNVLFTSGSRTDAAFLTLVPALETRFRGPVGIFTAGYSFSSEMHTQQFRSLDDAFARQLGSLGFEAKPSARSSVSGLLRYMSTRRPEEVLDPTGLVAGHRRTTSFLANLAIDYSLAPEADLRLGYTASADDFGQATAVRPGARSTLHALSVGLARRASPRTTIGLEYGGKFLLGDEFRQDGVTHGVFWAHSLGVRWTRSLTPRVTALLIAGPRAAQVVPAEISRTAPTPVRWELKPEVLASLTYRSEVRVASIAYARTQFLGVGASGLVDTESVELTAGAALGRRVRMSARPAIYRNSLAGLRANSYRLDGTADVRLSRWLTLNALYGYRHQDRSLALADFVVTAAARSRTRSRLVVGMTIRRPIGM
jgi:hypothetical protein